jgi:hypothetical protein
MSTPVLAVVGHPNKGKSSIVATLAHDPTVRISREPGTTTHTHRYPMQVDGQVLYTLADTPGFQRPRQVLDWLRQHDDDVSRRPESVRAFLRQFVGSGRFEDECELLTPVMDGAGILYVVDGSKPYGGEFEAEMEILRWTGQPRMALVNPIGGADHVEAWRTALDQYFNVVRVFNAVSADFVRQVALLRGFGELQEAWYAPFNAAVAALNADRARRHQLAARAIADMLAQMLGLSLSADRASDEEAGEARELLESQLRERLRGLEEAGRRSVERIYDHAGIQRQEAGLNPLIQDLFDHRTWTLFGLTPAQLALSGAVGGAVVGGGVDLLLGGASLFLGGAVGAAVGAASAWLGGGSLADVRLARDEALGGVRITVGPVKNVNFPYVVLGRALHHQRMVALRTHAQREPLQVSADDAARWVHALHEGPRRELERCFTALRRGDDDVVDRLDAQLRKLTPAVDASPADQA